MTPTDPHVEEAIRLVQWGAERFGEGLVMSTSFGIQSAAMLHLATRVAPSIPVIWIDTGYLPLETYHFAEALTERLGLNLRVYQSPISPARMEALYGRLWEADETAGLERYDRIRKLEPMQRALRELRATAWLAGLRRDQTDYRKSLSQVSCQGDRHKLLPILDWTTKQVHEYLKANDLPHHPLFDAGYASIGDAHSSRPLAAEDSHERDTRFGGRKQECGLHLPLSPEQAESLASSSL